MPKISITEAANKTLLRVEREEACLEVTYVDNGTTVVGRVPIAAAEANFENRLLACKQTLQSHSRIPTPLAHALTGSVLPVGLLEY